jgi:hypothetical protein
VSDRLTLARGIFGGLLLAAPIQARGPRRFCRLLGARHVAEAALLRHPSPRASALGAAVDATHGATAIVLARVWPSHALALAANAAVAGAFTAAGILRRGAEGRHG